MILYCHPFNFIELSAVNSNKEGMYSLPGLLVLLPVNFGSRGTGSVGAYHATGQGCCTLGRYIMRDIQMIAKKASDPIL
jgi:hypothetical protein